MRHQGHSCSVMVGLQTGAATKKHAELPYNLAIALLGIYLAKQQPRNTRLKDTHTPMFTTAIYTIAQTQKQLKCSLTEEWITM